MFFFWGGFTWHTKNLSENLKFDFWTLNVYGWKDGWCSIYINVDAGVTLQNSGVSRNLTLVQGPCPPNCIASDHFAPFAHSPLQWHRLRLPWLLRRDLPVQALGPDRIVFVFSQSCGAVLLGLGVTGYCHILHVGGLMARGMTRMQALFNGE